MENCAQVVRWGERCVAWRGDLVSDGFYYEEDYRLSELDIFQFRVSRLLFFYIFYLIINLFIYFI